MHSWGKEVRVSRGLEKKKGKQRKTKENKGKQS